MDEPKKGAVKSPMEKGVDAKSRMGIDSGGPVGSGPKPKGGVVSPQEKGIDDKSKMGICDEPPGKKKKS